MLKMVIELSLSSEMDVQIIGLFEVKCVLIFSWTDCSRLEM